MFKFFIKILIFTLLLIQNTSFSSSLEHFSSCPNKKAVIVIDSKKNVIFEHNANEKRYPASLTKLMTLYLIFDALKSGKISLNTKFKTSKLASIQEPSKLGLKVGEKISVLNIIKALAIKSANDAAVVAAEGLYGSVSKFCQKMNAKAKQLGMKNTHFSNPSGLPNKNQISSAQDLAILGKALFEKFPQYWHFLSEKKFEYKGKKHPTHCKVLHWCKGVDGAKTGYISASGFNLFVTANKYDKSGKAKRIFVVVMGGDTGKLRDLYAAKLMDKYLSGFDIAATKFQPKKQRASLLNQVAKSDMDNVIIQEEEEFSINEILKTSAVDKKFFDELYEHDDETIQIDNELYIAPRKKTKYTKKHKKKKNS